MTSLLTNIGINFLNLVEDNDNKKNLANLKISLNNYKDTISREEESLILLKNNYNINYVEPRIRNKVLYNDYILERTDLYNKWRKTKHINDLYELVKLTPPEFDNVEEIYTYYSK